MISTKILFSHIFGVKPSWMPAPFAIVRDALEQNKIHRSWRDSLRARLPQDRLHDILADLAEGKAWMAQLPDGQISVPVLPSSDIRLRAAMFLHEALYGKAVAQTEIQKAELEAKEFEAVRAMDDDQLEAAAAQIIEARKVQRLTQGVIVEAEYTVERIPAQNPPARISERARDWVDTVWESKQGADDDT